MSVRDDISESALSNRYSSVFFIVSVFSVGLLNSRSLAVHHLAHLLIVLALRMFCSEMSPMRIRKCNFMPKRVFLGTFI